MNVKKFVAIFIIIVQIALGVQVNGVEVDNEYEIILDEIMIYVREGKQNVTREECVTAIMRLIGMSQVDADIAEQKTRYEQQKFCDVDNLSYNGGYIIYAGDYGIALGTPGVDGRMYFAPDRLVTIKECLAFALRCTSADEWDNILLQAEQLKLIPTGAFKGNEFVSYRVLRNVLKNLLDVNRYFYWERHNTDKRAASYFGLRVDKNRSMTYKQWYDAQYDGYIGAVLICKGETDTAYQISNGGNMTKSCGEYGVKVYSAECLLNSEGTHLTNEKTGEVISFKETDLNRKNAATKNMIKVGEKKISADDMKKIGRMAIEAFDEKAIDRNLEIADKILVVYYFGFAKAFSMDNVKACAIWDEIISKY